MLLGRQRPYRQGYSFSKKETLVCFFSFLFLIRFKFLVFAILKRFSVSLLQSLSSFNRFSVAQGDAAEFLLATAVVSELQAAQGTKAGGGTVWRDVFEWDGFSGFG